MSDILNIKVEEKCQLGHCVMSGILSVGLNFKPLSKRWWVGIFGDSRCEQNVAKMMNTKLGKKSLFKFEKLIFKATETHF